MIVWPFVQAIPDEHRSAMLIRVSLISLRARGRLYQTGFKPPIHPS